MKPSTDSSTDFKKGPPRYLVPCLCGTMRAIPFGIKFGQRFTLVPCPMPNCGRTISGRFLKYGIWRDQ